MSRQNKDKMDLNSTSFPIIETEMISIPSRNYLVSVTPIGIGTPEVESLSSYISRIAHEYFVSPIELMKVCIKKYLNSNPNTDDIRYDVNTYKNINGLEKITETVVFSIIKATGRQELFYTTLLPWQAVLSSKQLKNRRAWCASCFQSDLENKTPIYERLLWKIDIVTTCPIHNQDLTLICPHCKSGQSNFSTYSFPGVCSECKIWLGENHQFLTKEKTNKLNIRIANEVGKILAASHKVRSDVQARIVFANSIRSIMDEAPFISYSCLRKKTGLATRTIRNLVFSETLISFRVLMKLCLSFDCSAVDILLGNKFCLIEKKTIK